MSLPEELPINGTGLMAQEAVEAKERVTGGQRGRILDTITIANYMGMYAKMAGMTATV